MKEKNKNTAVAKATNPFENISFDSAFNMDEKEKKHALGFTQVKQSKRLQITAKINNLQLQKVKLENEFNMSLTQPDKDSGAILVQIKCTDEEIKVETGLYNQLFPETKLI